MKKVSVLVPVYGVEKFIEKCARSLFEQTYKNIEYVFVNDCTKDDSIKKLQQVLQDYPDRQGQVVIVNHQINKGVAGARNTAIQKATGDYIFWVDSDDFLELDAIELLVNKSVETSADIVIGGAKNVYIDKVVENENHIPENKTVYIQSLLSQKIAPNIWGKLYTRKLWYETGIFFEEGANYGEDFAVIPRLIYYADKVVKLDKKLYNYVCNSESYTHNITKDLVDAVVKGEWILSHFFSQIPEKDLYEKTLLAMKLRIKLSLFKMGSPEVYDYVASLYPGLFPRYKSYLSKKDIILLYLIGWKLYRMAHLYAQCGLWLKHKMTNR